VAGILDITDILDRKPNEIGGGQKQRVSLARALVRDPDVLLLDEPLSHLDAAQRAHMRTELKRLHALIGRTTVLVTHDQLEAVAMAERVAIMDFGVLQQVGKFEEIYKRPVNEFVAGFIGEPPMNFLPCRPEAGGDTLYLQADDNSFRLKLPPEWRARVLTKSPQATHLGIRPIDTIAHEVASDGLLEMPGTVHTFEDLGEEGQLSAYVGQNTVLVVTPPTARFEPSDKLRLKMRTDRIYIFDAQSRLSV
jgi:multiple sugar transport system ATP-binding protein